MSEVAASIRTFEQFWPYYVRQHTKRATRVVHAVGSILALLSLFAALGTRQWYFIALAPVIGYGFAWYSHFFIEKNRPATFGHPLYSLAADYWMLFLMLADRMDEEVDKYVR